MTQKEILEYIKQRNGDTDFVYSLKDKQWYSYNQIWNMATAYKSFFEKRDTREVVFLLENGLPLFIAYFACMISDFTIIPVDPQKSPNEINQILSQHAGATIIKTEDDLPGVDELGDTGYCADLERQIDLDRLFMITYTSGSTGQAKGVKHSLKNLFASGLSFGHATGFGENSVVCHTMPMTYMAGILNTIIMPFIMGCRIVLFPRFDIFTAVSFWKNVIENKVNTFWLSPTMLNMLLTVDRRGKAKEYFEQNKSLFCIGTAPLFPQLKRKFEERYSVRLLVSYGLSETLFLSTETLLSRECAGTVGEILPEVDLKFGEDGEILVDVPWMFPGYFNEETDSFFTDGYYHTGDLGYMESGKLFINGRKKDLIIRGGMNISPRQLEDVILTAPFIKECCVSSVVIEEEERIVCWLVLGEKYDNISNRLNQLIADKIGKNYTVDKYVIVGDIPKNLNGKVDKEQLKKGYRNDLKI